MKNKNNTKRQQPEKADQRSGRALQTVQNTSRNTDQNRESMGEQMKEARIFQSRGYYSRNGGYEGYDGL